MYLSAQCVAFGASTPGSVSADIPLGDFHSEQPDRSLMENGDFPWNPSHWERFAGGDSSRCTQLHNSLKLWREDFDISNLLYRQYSLSKSSQWFTLWKTK